MKLSFYSMYLLNSLLKYGIREGKQDNTILPCLKKHHDMSSKSESFWIEWFSQGVDNTV